MSILCLDPSHKTIAFVGGWLPLDITFSAERASVQILLISCEYTWEIAKLCEKPKRNSPPTTIVESQEFRGK